ncbi:Sulfide:quinone oxidoreductase, mitochondrial [Hondaea fermentalgiana]|uniref:Sulfide:quinone oxidoreductase, mitochondrial n=1 Tax=Hondaea fermentalgiana TaxID=2315210 RepID=A0A2R5GNH3_9STRA|nr:Sulfide:quinone oxidoreductase, mitochondrial [Hondaea fermentalgiana]|eukprot:GBG30163.1 Sulfide:quinone oxidoreductase, mitochondrial [Hondaea fermentalgiana]
MGSQCSTTKSVAEDSHGEVPKIITKDEPKGASTSTQETKAPHIVVVGAGFGGLAVALGLRKELDEGLVTMTLIERSTTFAIKGCLQFVLDGRKTFDEITHNLEDAKVSDKVRKCFGWSVSSLDVDGKSLKMGKIGGNDAEETVSFDYLVLATGVVSDPTSIPGLADSMLNFCDDTHTMKIKEALDAVPEGGTVLVTTAAVPYKCPPVPFEYAFLADSMLRKRGIRDSVNVIITSPKAPFPFGGPVPKKVFLAACADRNIEFRAGIKPVKVRSDEKVVEFKHSEGEGEDQEVTFDALIGSYPQRAPDLLADLCNPKGFVPVDLITMETKKPGVFCIGDSSWMMLKTEPPKPHPKSGAFAKIAGENVATMLGAIAHGDSLEDARAKVSKKRIARCFAETGDGEGILIEPKLLDDEDGPMGFRSEGPTPEFGAAKVDWINEIEMHYFGKSNFHN